MMRHVGRSVVLLILAFAGVLSYSTAAPGHALEPGYLELRQIDESLYAVVWKKPSSEGAPMAIAVSLPEQCDPRTEGQLVWDGRAYYARWAATCAGGLEGGTLQIAGLEQTSTDVLVRFDFTDGVTGTHRLTPTDTSFVVPKQADRLEVVRTYFGFGVEHILLGIDHLLFVLALLLLVKGVRRIVATVTAFTLAHSITLAGATLGWVHMPGPPIEAAIALSIAFVAAEILHSRQGRPGLAERYPWIVAFTFGLLHGFGFAGALAQVGLPQTEIPMALLFFNVGVEVGQLLFISAVFASFWLMHRITRRINVPQVTWASALPAYVIGSLAIFWVLQRTVGFFP
jgi:hydrogenase/urease accessory protein HupE